MGFDKGMYKNYYGRCEGRGRSEKDRRWNNWSEGCRISKRNKCMVDKKEREIDERKYSDGEGRRWRKGEKWSGKCDKERLWNEKKEIEERKSEMRGEGNNKLSDEW